MTKLTEYHWINWAYHEHGPFLMQVKLLNGHVELIPTSQRVAMAYEASRKLGRFIDPTKLSSETNLALFTIASHQQWPWYKVCHYRGII